MNLFPWLLFATYAGAAINVVHYAPLNSDINNLTVALNGTGAPGIYNSSDTPDGLYGMYNWCNMPHVRKSEYPYAAENYTLEYVEVIHRHHKRTPYASNTFFKEDVDWDCTGSGPVHYVKSSEVSDFASTEIQWQRYSDSQNPFASSVGPGFVNSTCQFPQMTPESLNDCHTHGSDLRGVYAELLGLSDTYDPARSTIRVTNNDITSQVAGGVVRGLFPSSDSVPVLIQPEVYDSLEPSLSCPLASSTRKAYAGTHPDWTAHLDGARELYEKLDMVSGIEREDEAGWHTSLDHYYDNLSAKQCHGKSLPCSVNDTSLCVTQEEADTVYRLGNWEYSYSFRDAEDSTLYSALNFGAWMLELKGHLQSSVEGTSETRYFHNVAHDGSMASLLGFLQVAKMVWPGMGSEIVFELFRSEDRHFVRVLWGGQIMETSTPMGALDMIPVETFIGYIDSMVGSGKALYTSCNS